MFVILANKNGVLKIRLMFDRNIFMMDDMKEEGDVIPVFSLGDDDPNGCCTSTTGRTRN